MPPHARVRAHFVLISFIVLLALAGPKAWSQAPQATVPDPAADSLLGEECCFDAHFLQYRRRGV